MNISVIIPTYNSSNFICKTLDAIINQTLKPHEIIIVDDVSTDNTLEVLENYKHVNKIDFIHIYINHRNSGPGLSRNFGIKKSKCSIIAFCDSDDVWSLNKLELQSKLVENHPIVGTSFIIIDNKGRNKTINYHGIYNYKNMLMNNYIACSSVMINLKFISKDDIVFESCIHEDYLLWLRLLKKYNFTCYIMSEKLLFYNRRNESFSSGLVKKIKSTHNIYMLIFNNQFISFFYTARKVFLSVSKYI
jgi:glycosyltransferase involved in cell wall biosynthesis